MTDKEAEAYEARIKKKQEDNLKAFEEEYLILCRKRGLQKSPAFNITATEGIISYLDTIPLKH